MSFQRRILHHGPDPAGTPQLLSLTALRSCWFELHRQGGCGTGELVLSDDFELRDEIELGDWISFETETEDRWYLGRVEERSAEIPAQIRYRLEGMAIELNQVFPGGFGSAADGRNPHRYAATDLFPFDPDHAQETFDFAGSADAVVRLLLTQYVTSSGHIQYVPEKVESPGLPSPVTSLKVRGEESVRSLIKDLALRAQSAAWGVDAQGDFFFLRPRTTLLATFREQQDLTTLAETRDFEFLFNRLLLTGDYVYDQQAASGDVARKVYRWRGNYFEPTSRTQYGDRRLKIWLPWVRTQNDSVAFAREFFRTYSQPSNRYFIETTAQTDLPLPWLGLVRVLARDGSELINSRVETIRVLFDHVPRFRMELGAEDPRSLWPEPPQDERWELPNQIVSAGGLVSFPPPLPPRGGGGGNGDGGSSGSLASGSADFSLSGSENSFSDSIGQSTGESLTFTSSLESTPGISSTSGTSNSFSESSELDSSSIIASSEQSSSLNSSNASSTSHVGLDSTTGEFGDSTLLSDGSSSSLNSSESSDSEGSGSPPATTYIFDH